MNEKEKFAANLRQAMIRKGFPLKPSVLETIFNLKYEGQYITPQAASQWLNGKMIPRLDKLKTLAIVLNVDLSELVPPNKLQKLQAAELKRIGTPEELRWENIATQQDKALFSHFLDLPEQQRNVVREVIMALFDILPALKDGDSYQLPRLAWATLGGFLLLTSDEVHFTSATAMSSPAFHYA